MLRIPSAPIYPFLILLFPVTRFFLVNQDRMQVASLAVAASVLCIIFAALYALLRVLKFSTQAAAILVAVAAGLFWAVHPASLILFRQRILAPLETSQLSVLAACTGLFVALAYLLRAFKNITGPLHSFAGITSWALFLMLIIFPPSGPALPKEYADLRFPELLHDKSSPSSPAANPDIFLIILDGYGRTDLLEELFNYDNSGFVTQLADLGFYVARQSTSNYSQTLLSLASILNLDYLDVVTKGIPQETKNRRPLRSLLRTNRLVEQLRRHNYEFIMIGSGYASTEMSSADRNIGLAFDPGEFGNLLLAQSPFPAFVNLVGNQQLSSWQFDVHRARLRNAFEALSQLKREAKPKFVVTHILAPHPPFVFKADGTAQNSRRLFGFHDGSLYRGSRDEYRSGYVGQARWVESQVIDTIQKIESRSPGALIIIQGDHGPGLHLNWRRAEKTNFRERMSILNAYKVPASLKSKLYSEITPVNSFRLVLNELFSANLSLLPDKNYFSLLDRPYAFIDVTEKVRGGAISQVPLEADSEQSQGRLAANKGTK